MINDNVVNDNNEIYWSEEHENILVEWADKAMCYRWLHSKSNLVYSRMNAMFTIPVIIMSTLTGTANFALAKYSPTVINYGSMVIGGINIFAGILTTIQQFLKVSEYNEAHRVSAIAWDKFYRNIKIELAKSPEERVKVDHMIKLCKEEFDRLMETSPMIKENIILEFKHTFTFADPIKNEAFEKLKKPEICDELISTNNYRHQWYKQDNKSQYIEMQKQHELNKNKTSILDFKKHFYELNGRDALDSEVIDNLKDKIDYNIIIKILDNIKYTFHSDIDI
jgi:hypothetical protein